MHCGTEFPTCVRCVCIRVIVRLRFYRFEMRTYLVDNSTVHFMR